MTVGLGSNTHDQIIAALQETCTPSRFLDAEIYRLTMDPNVAFQRLSMLMDGEGAFHLPAFTGSLDAALKLPTSEDTLNDAIHSVHRDGWYPNDMHGAIARTLCRRIVKLAQNCDLLQLDPRYNTLEATRERGWVAQGFVGTQIAMGPKPAL